MMRLVLRQRHQTRRRIDDGYEKPRHGHAAIIGPSAADYTAGVIFRGQTLGKYRIIEPLGSGGFGTVYLAEDTWIDKRVAIKVPHRQALDFGELLREPRLLASLNHPNIVTVITAEKQDNVFFIVMEYVPGETLETIIVNRGALELAQTLDYTCQIANAVEHAHKQGVIHRDLRPANVFVTDRGLLKVGDFGTSRFLEIAAHGTTVIGSPPYMAPEQFEGRAVFASDLYSLGITMYQMLTGGLPYDMPSPSDFGKLKRGELVQPPRTRNSAIPKAIDDIVMRALAPEVGARYQRAEDLLNDLLAARRELVRRPSPPEMATSGAVSQAAAAAPAQAGRVERVFPPPPRRPLTARVRTREMASSRFCWNCRKPLPAKARRCPFCSETQ
jgi:serine/threonine-protein kinase